MLETFISQLGQSVKMTELYDSIGLSKSDYSRFVKRELIDSYYFEINKDYIPFMKSNAILGKKGQFRQEFYITINAAKIICSNSRLIKSKEIYVYLCSLDNIECVIHKNRKELLFEINLNEIFKDIFEIKMQFKVLNYRIDFYIPEIKLAIEYDENAHIYKKSEDKKRQLEIQKFLKCDFVRVKEGFENNAINEIFKYILYNACCDYNFNETATPLAKKLINSLNIKSYNEIENEAFIEILNKSICKPM